MFRIFHLNGYLEVIQLAFLFKYSRIIDNINIHNMSVFENLLVFYVADWSGFFKILAGEVF